MRLPPARQSRAFATVAIIILLMAASAFLVTTGLTFRNLHHELRFQEKKQLQRWEQRNAAATNHVAQPAAPIPAP